LVRVLRDEAYAAAALSAELDKVNLDARDRALATQLVYGVLRTKAHLDKRLAAFGKVKVSDHVLTSHLLCAVYQIDFLDRVPAHAAVNEAVDSISRAKGKKVGGFANAILRRVVASKGADGLSESVAARLSCPNWLERRLVDSVGQDETTRLLAPPGPAPLYLRSTESSFDETVARFIETDCEAIVGVPGAYRYLGGGDPRRRAEFERGKFVVQELGAQLIAHAGAARPGSSVLDACAGRGQKTGILAAHVGPAGRIVATDLHAHKVDALAEAMRTQGFSNVEARAFDWTTELPPEWRESFDLVVVDAPCSGSGTLSRRPEIARRLKPEDPARLGQLQLAILQNAGRAVRPGGALLFATCSVLSEEGVEVVDQLLLPEGAESRESEWKLDAWPSAVDGALFGGAPPTASFRLLPSRHATDGYFVARLRRR
jgi:16S rRNA (cytosine967-C5)-methyltransferase